MYWLAGLCIILAVCLMTPEAVPVRLDPGRVVMGACEGQPETCTGLPAGTPAATDDSADNSDDEDALPVLLTTTAFTGLVSYLTLPGLTDLSFHRSPLLHPPQPGSPL